MPVVFLLGPSEWLDGATAGKTPMAHRRDLLALLTQAGVDAFVMEDEPDVDGEDLVAKFERLLQERRVDEVVPDWPPGAKMQTTYDEMLLLRTLRDRMPLPRIWFLHHEDVAEIRHGVFRILERGRSRYLTAVARLGVHPVPWRSMSELHERVRLLAREVG